MTNYFKTTMIVIGVIVVCYAGLEMAKWYTQAKVVLPTVQRVTVMPHDLTLQQQYDYHNTETNRVLDEAERILKDVVRMQDEAIRLITESHEHEAVMAVLAEEMRKAKL